MIRKRLKEVGLNHILDLCTQVYIQFDSSINTCTCTRTYNSAVYLYVGYDIPATLFLNIVSYSAVIAGKDTCTCRGNLL